MRVSESSPSWFSARHVTLCHPSIRKRSHDLTSLEYPSTDTLYPPEGTLPFTLHLTAARGFEFTIQTHVTSNPASKQDESGRRMSGLSGKEREKRTTR